MYLTVASEIGIGLPKYIGTPTLFWWTKTFLDTRDGTGIKGQLNSEWIHEVIVSPKILKISALPSNKLPGQKSL